MEIIIIAILILLNGVFSMSEIALISSKKYKLVSAAKKGNANAKKALDLSENPNTFLSTVQFGITLIGILTGIFSGKALTSDLTAYLQTFTFISPYADTVAVVIIVVLITYITIVFGELIPKRLGLHFPEKVASAVATPMTILSSIAKPVIWLLGKTNDLVLGLFGIKDREEGHVSEEEINQIIKESTEGGEIQQIEQDIVRRVFSLGDRKVGELMTHRNDLTWIDIDDTVADIKAKLEKDTHSIYPVCDKSIDNLIGMVSLKQLFRVDPTSEDFDLKAIIHKPVYVPESMAAYRALEYFKPTKLHCAAVVDEYGSIQGFITFIDIMDELIGDNVHLDPNEYQITVRDENSWLLDGQLPYFELLEYFDISEENKSEGFTTVGGLFMSRSNHIPKTAEKISWRGFELEIMDMDGLRIDKILLTRKN